MVYKGNVMLYIVIGLLALSIIGNIICLVLMDRNKARTINDVGLGYLFDMSVEDIGDITIYSDMPRKVIIKDVSMKQEVLNAFKDIVFMKKENFKPHYLTMSAHIETADGVVFISVLADMMGIQFGMDGNDYWYVVNKPMRELFDVIYKKAADEYGEISLS